MYGCGGYYRYTIYPNPVKDFISVEFEDSKEEKNFPEKFEIFSEISSKKVIEVNIETEQQKDNLKTTRKLSINVTNLTRGRYILRSTQLQAKEAEKTTSIHVVLE